jgi:hypothetical protein
MSPNSSLLQTASKQIHRVHPMVLMAPVAIAAWMAAPIFAGAEPAKSEAAASMQAGADGVNATRGGMQISTIGAGAARAIPAMAGPPPAIVMTNGAGHPASGRAVGGNFGDSGGGGAAAGGGAGGRGNSAHPSTGQSQTPAQVQSHMQANLPQPAPAPGLPPPVHIASPRPAAAPVTVSPAAPVAVASPVAPHVVAPVVAVPPPFVRQPVILVNRFAMQRFVYPMAGRPFVGGGGGGRHR